MGKAKRVAVEPVVVVIRASKWWRATKRNPHGAGGLTNGRRDCCLAVDGRAVGVTRTQMDDNTMPSYVPGERGSAVDKWRRAWGKDAGVQLCRLIGVDFSKENALEDVAASINDDRKTTDDEKIEKLRPLFAKLSPPRVIDWRPNE